MNVYKMGDTKILKKRKIYYHHHHCCVYIELNTIEKFINKNIKRIQYTKPEWSSKSIYD